MFIPRVGKLHSPGPASYPDLDFYDEQHAYKVSQPGFIEEIARSALLREVHVYGTSLPLGTPPGAAAQHGGLGTALVEEAARRAREAGHADLAVISAIGTRAWYRGLGFQDGALYQHLPLR